MPSTERDKLPRAPGRLRRAAAWLGLCAVSACQAPAPQPARAPSSAPAPHRAPAPAPEPAPAPVKEKSKDQLLKDLESGEKVSREALHDALIPLLIAKGVITQDELVRKAKELDAVRER